MSERAHDPSPALLEMEDVSVRFASARRRGAGVRALDGVSLTVGAGETVGVVGESGCGKTTLIRCAARLTDVDGGRIIFEGREITRASRRALRPVRGGMQVVFQDPEGSLNPRRRVGAILATPLRLRGVPRSRLGAETAALLAEVGMAAEHAERYPHELSGGQRQRVGIARALATRPRLLLLDEPVSALDVSVQAQIVNLLEELRRRHGLSCLFVAHDLAIVAHVSDRIAVMYLGRIVESGPAETLLRAPIHPYTQALIAALPTPDPSVPAPTAPPPPPEQVDCGPPAGCRFADRCPHADELCRTVEPPLTEHPGGRAAACHHPLSAGAAGDPGRASSTRALGCESRPRR